MPFKGVLISVSNPLLFKNRKSLHAGPTINTRRSKLERQRRRPRHPVVAEPTLHGQGHCTRETRSGEKTQPLS